MSLNIEKNLSGQVFNIQRYSTHDGPGIRTTVFLKGCPLSCFWCQNPESQKSKPELLVRGDKCTLCGRCIEVCESGANKIVDGKLFIDRELCSACGLCVIPCIPQAREIEGSTMTVEEVIKEVKKDIRLYLNTNGGMTLSGGDCESQPTFSQALLNAAHDEGIHTAVEITGAFPWETVKRITDHADFIYYDLKHMDDNKHKEGTGISNKHVLENAKNLVLEGKNIHFRTPLIPGYNDSKDHIKEIVNFIRNDLHLNPAERLELLAYNELGENKYARLGRDHEAPIGYKRQSEEYFNELKEIVAKGYLGYL